LGQDVAVHPAPGACSLGVELSQSTRRRAPFWTWPWCPRVSWLYGHASSLFPTSFHEAV